MSRPYVIAQHAAGSSKSLLKGVKTLALSPSHVISYAASLCSICVDQFLDRKDVLGTFLPDAVSQRGKQSEQASKGDSIELASQRIWPRHQHPRRKKIHP